MFYANGMFQVGPESAKADPGPVCYRKKGFLTVTDANLLLGRSVIHPICDLSYPLSLIAHEDMLHDDMLHHLLSLLSS